MKLDKSIKIATKVLPIYPTKQNLLIVQDLWKVHYQIFLIMLQKKSVKLTVKIVIVFLNMRIW